MSKVFKKFPSSHKAITSCWRHHDSYFKWRRYSWSPWRRLVIFTAGLLGNVFADDKLFAHYIQNCVARQQHVYLLQEVKMRYFCNFMFYRLCFVCLVFVMPLWLFVPCGHLLGKGWPLGFHLWCLTVSLSLFHWYLGQVWYLIVSVPDLCTLTYFVDSLDGDLSLLTLNCLRIIAIGTILFQYWTVFEETTLSVYRSKCTSGILKFGYYLALFGIFCHAITLTCSRGDQKVRGK